MFPNKTNLRLLIGYLNNITNTQKQRKCFWILWKKHRMLHIKCNKILILHINNNFQFSIPLCKYNKCHFKCRLLIQCYNKHQINWYNLIIILIIWLIKKPMIIKKTILLMKMLKMLIINKTMKFKNKFKNKFKKKNMIMNNMNKSYLI